MSEHLYRNARWYPKNSGYAQDLGGSQEQSFSSGSSHTGVAIFQKPVKTVIFFVIVAPIELKIAPCAQFCVSRLLRPSLAQSIQAPFFTVTWMMTIIIL